MNPGISWVRGVGLRGLEPPTHGFIETNLVTPAPSCYTSTVRTARRCSSVDRAILS